MIRLFIVILTVLALAPEYASSAVILSTYDDKGVIRTNFDGKRRVTLYGLHTNPEDLKILLQEPPDLKILEISECPKINDDSILGEVIEYHSELEKLVLDGLAISDETMKSVAKLTKLKKLYLRCDFVTFDGLRYLIRNPSFCQSLETLELKGDRILSIDWRYPVGKEEEEEEEEEEEGDDEEMEMEMEVEVDDGGGNSDDEEEEEEEPYGQKILDEFFQSFPNLKELFIGGINLEAHECGKSETLKALASLKKLEYLVLPASDCVNDEFVRKYITQLSNLRVLHFRSPSITEKSLEYLTSLKYLSSIVCPFPVIDRECPCPPNVREASHDVQPISSAPKMPDSDANSEEKSETSNVDTNDSIDKSDQKD